MKMSEGDLVVFSDRNDTPSEHFGHTGPPYENKLGLVLRSGGCKSSYIYFFGLKSSNQRVWNLSHDYLKVVSVAD